MDNKLALNEIIESFRNAEKRFEEDPAFEYYLTTKDLAKILNMTPGAIINLRHQGDADLPQHITIGNRTVRYPMSAVIKWSREKAEKQGRGL